MGSATKHKSLNSMKRYHHTTSETQIEPALKIAAKGRKLVKRRIVYDSEDDEEELQQEEKDVNFVIHKSVFEDSESDWIVVYSWVVLSRLFN